MRLLLPAHAGRSLVVQCAGPVDVLLPAHAG